ncbi:16S rRNA (guanine(966)-N(2))-methyltransferase RsmD [Chromobacterium sp. IIBBL 290-4]|uniref:16S rRNA (guanine(966)-N(2))-methyltransferase RsmD n=1 Tax=Chromobacterium sp. IIBBL 290-4 TaxID=2953890 RepID=UPI0020B683EB|nr:16S rRNA (guanine(966)-N(2))-methyltransferase RsmD [Chromobacterium sp. IIBBL 290-4]UTH75433.1 16S rRNA (guanine(966)-N(2))-methyltransferase RsmD [Chromobacterium sp. IIBBL 290-4]
MSQARNKVRIIGGEHRRRLLPFPDAEGLRPTPDRVRETLFNWLGQDLHGKSCLDLFAGSGALGFEAASRGARRVVMVEKSRKVYESLRDNRQLLSAAAIDVVNGDALLYLKNGRERFDVIFLDPPYDSDLLAQALPLLAGLLADDGVVYMEARQWPEALPDGWDCVRQDKAGTVHYGLLAPAQA